MTELSYASCSATTLSFLTIQPFPANEGIATFAALSSFRLQFPSLLHAQHLTEYMPAVYSIFSIGRNKIYPSQFRYASRRLKVSEDISRVSTRSRQPRQYFKIFLECVVIVGHERVFFAKSVIVIIPYHLI